MNLPKGFEFSGVACGIKESGKLDLTLIATDQPAVAAGVYTQNVVRAASIDWNRGITPSENFRGLVINSGNANACTGQRGAEDNETMATQVANLLQAKPNQIAVLSTGVIGHHLPMDKIECGIVTAAHENSASPEAFENASQGILTTDKGAKTIHQTIDFDSGSVQLAAMAKGAGMIGPNMATMLAVVMTDAKLSAALAQELLTDAANQSFNRISVEGHTSTNDALILICSGAANAKVKSLAEIDRFRSALNESCIQLAKQIPSDGEGATHLISILITGAKTDQDAELIAGTIASSNLVKTAITGADPNWGRIVSAAGYSGAPMQVEKTDLQLNGHYVFKSGQPCAFEAAVVSKSISDNFETQIELAVGSGQGTSRHWTSDLTVDYVRFNSEYTT